MTASQPFAQPSRSTAPRLLVVDDDAEQMRALCRTLDIEGYPTAGYVSPEQALAAFRADAFDLILTDLTMPAMNGIELLQRLRQADPNVIGIVITGHGSIDTAVAAMKAGAFDYILKPFTLKMIIPVLERAWSVRQLVRENFQLRETGELIRKLNSQLERCVEERTRQLQDTNQELEAFSHSVSHDLRGPLRVIDGFSQLLRDRNPGLDADSNEYFARILTAVRRMDDLITDLMRLSVATSADLQRTEVNLSSLVGAIIDELREREPERKVSASIQPGLVCRADPQLLRIALENIVGNAWKFTSGVSTANIEFAAAPGERDTYFVRDNGAGFPSERASEVFTTFRRLHSTAEFPGTGVGLSIVQRVVRRHGGTVSAEGIPGQGATFYFSLPQRHDDARWSDHS